MRTFQVLGVACLVLFSAAAVAEQRGTSLGTWRTGDFSAPELVSRWGHGDTNGAHNEIAVDAGRKRAGRPSVRLVTNAGFDNWVYFPDTKDWDIDLTGAESLKGYLRSENPNGWGGDPWILFVDKAGHQARFDGQRRRLFEATKDWTELVVPVGADLQRKCAEYGWQPKIDGEFDWKHVACVQIHQDTDNYGYTIWYSGFAFTGNGPVRWWLSSHEQPDLTVGFAEQVPQYRRNFPTEPDPHHNIPELVGKEATEKHWPDAGEAIRYVVHVKNAGFVPSAGSDLVCRIDGQVVKRAEVPPLAPRQETRIEVPWTWKQGPYPVVITVDPENRMCEITKKNNTLEFLTDAYALVAVCDRRIVEPIERVNNWYGSYAFEDWMRGATVDQINRMCRRCRYDFAPRGAEISVRLANILYVDEITDANRESVDQSLKLDIYDGTWHYDLRALDEWCDLANDFDWALVHELTHQLGIIDNYQYDLGPDSNAVNHKQYDRGPGGIMGGGRVGDNAYPAYAEVDVAGMNLTRGHRRGFFGEYLYCIPLQNTLVVSADGKPLAHAPLEVFQKDMHTGRIDAPPVFRGNTDASGEFPLPNREVPKTFTTATGCTLHPNPFGYPDVVGRNGLFLIRAQVNGRWHFAFLDIGHFVAEYARGHRDAARYPVELQPE